VKPQTSDEQRGRNIRTTALKNHAATQPRSHAATQPRSQGRTKKETETSEGAIKARKIILSNRAVGLVTLSSDASMIFAAFTAQR
jgi:hypothetical protein